LLDRIVLTPYSRGHYWHSNHEIAKNPGCAALGGVEYIRIPGHFRQQTHQQTKASRGTVMAKTKFRPLHDRVVVKRIDAEEKTKGGIIIPDTAKEKPSQGEVTAVGPGGRDEAGKLIPIDLKVGDRVLFGKWSGTEVKLDGEELLIMKESDIMGVLA
jgi:chaperonin GroES